MLESRKLHPSFKFTVQQGTKSTLFTPNCHYINRKSTQKLRAEDVCEKRELSPL